MDRQYTIGCITSSVSYHGGWDTLSKGIIGAVAKKHEVIALTARDAQNDPVPYVVHRVLPANYITYGFLNQLCVFLASLWYLRKCDAIHTFVEPFTPGAALASLFLRKPLFITIAGTYCVIPKGNKPRERIKRCMMRFMYRQASFIATGSYRNIELIEEVQSLEGKWEFVPFGVDPKKYIDSGNYSKPPHPFILTTGSIKPRKGALYTIRALAELKDQFPDLRYKLAGSFNDENLYVKELRKEIETLGLQERVEFLGRVDDETLKELYATCSVFVLAAQTVAGSFEGFPMVFYEAHSFGAPVVSTYGFGSEYVVKNGENGFLVPQGDHLALASAIRDILKDPELRARMSARGREEAGKHTWDNISVQYLRAYDRVLG